MLDLIARQIVVVGKSLDGLTGIDSIRNGRRRNSGAANDGPSEGHMRVDRYGSFGRSLRRIDVGVQPHRELPLVPLDTLEVALETGHWQPVELRGSWFIEAFEGPMSNLQRFVAGEDACLVSPVDDAIKTMALVEACYQSSAAGGTPIPRV